LVCDVLHGLPVGDCVADTDAETVMEEPVVDNLLKPHEKSLHGLWPLLSENDMNKASCGCTNSLLVNNAEEYSAVVDTHPIVEGRVQIWFVFGRVAEDVDTLWNGHAQNLFA